jgi:hypothetical protein
MHVVFDTADLMDVDARSLDDCFFRQRCAIDSTVGVSSGVLFLVCQVMFRLISA